MVGGMRDRIIGTLLGVFIFGGNIFLSFWVATLIPVSLQDAWWGQALLVLLIFLSACVSVIGLMIALACLVT